MAGNWDIQAILADPSDPNREWVQERVRAKMAEKDSRDGHVHPLFRLPDPGQSTSSVPAGDASHPSERPILHARARSISPTPSARKGGELPDISASFTRKGGRLRSNSDSLAAEVDIALPASKHAACDRTKDGARQGGTPNTRTNNNMPRLEIPLRGSKREAHGANQEEERGRDAKRRMGHDGLQTASPCEEK